MQVHDAILNEDDFHFCMQVKYYTFVVSFSYNISKLHLAIRVHKMLLAMRL